VKGKNPLDKNLRRNKKGGDFWETINRGFLAWKGQKKVPNTTALFESSEIKKQE